MRILSMVSFALGRFALCFHAEVTTKDAVLLGGFL